MARTAAIYARVSTANGQTVENQLRELRKAAKRHGWRITHTFTDEGISGSKGRDSRPQYDALLRGVARREFELVMAWSVDRLGRSLRDLVGFLGELHGKDVGLYLHQQGIDTTTPAGKAMFGMLGVFAEFERAMIRERVHAGLARARAQGKQLGRPRGSTVPTKTRRHVEQLRSFGLSIRAIAAETGVTASTVHRVVSVIGRSPES